MRKQVKTRHVNIRLSRLSQFRVAASPIATAGVALVAIILASDLKASVGATISTSTETSSDLLQPFYLEPTYLSPSPLRLNQNSSGAASRVPASEMNSTLQTLVHSKNDSQTDRQTYGQADDQNYDQRGNSGSGDYGGDHLRNVAKKPLVLTAKGDYSRGLDYSVIHPIVPNALVTKDDVGLVIPVEDLKNESTSTGVERKIIDHSLSSFFNSPYMKSTEVGKTATKVEKNMQSNVSFGGDAPQAIHHNLKIEMKPTQSKACVEYTGLTNANLTYNVAASETNLEVKERLSLLKTQFVYNWQAKPSDTRNVVSMRWIW